MEQGGSDEARAAFIFGQMVAARAAGLKERLSELPPWWVELGNVLMARPDAAPPAIAMHPGVPPPSNARVICWTDYSGISSVLMWADGPFVSIGPSVWMPGGVLNCQGGSQIHLEGRLSAGGHAELNARNGGVIRVGAGGLWSERIRVFTDDMHTIRDQQTGARLNPRGTRVSIGERVWLGMDVLVMPNADIGPDCVVGARAVVTGCIPANTVSAGAPARVVRSGVVWSEHDEA